MDARYFRVGAGTVLYRPNGEIVVFQRSDIREVWQLQQGGANPLESSIDTAWRELTEETGLTQSHVLTVHEYPDWLFYAYPPAMQINLRQRDCLGQIHRWYFMQLAPDTNIDLSQATDKEFVDWRFSTFDALLAQQIPPHDMKKTVYTKLAHYFNNTVLSLPPTPPAP